MVTLTKPLFYTVLVSLFCSVIKYTITDNYREVKMSSSHPTIIQELISMGFDENLVSIAVSQCPDGSIEDLVSCILLLSGDPVRDMDEDITVVAETVTSTAEIGVEGSKMVLVVRIDLGMSPGKVAAQCVHAALGGVRSSDAHVVANWEQSGEPVICLRCGTLEEMNELRANAIRYNLCAYVVRDAGRTEVPGGSQTVLAIGPNNISKIDAVTRHLKLF